MEAAVQIAATVIFNSQREQRKIRSRDVRVSFAVHRRRNAQREVALSVNRPCCCYSSVEVSRQPIPVGDRQFVVQTPPQALSVRPLRHVVATSASAQDTAFTASTLMPQLGEPGHRPAPCVAPPVLLVVARIADRRAHHEGIGGRRSCSAAALAPIDPRLERIELGAE
jgi:hypothetical protein